MLRFPEVCVIELTVQKLRTPPPQPSLSKEKRRGDCVCGGNKVLEDLATGVLRCHVAFSLFMASRC